MLASIWNGLLNLIFQALQFFESWTHDWGWAIILLTVSMRIIMIPLTVKQTKSMHEMQAIQPKLKALQEKYKKDKEKLQEETLKFYQENKVNPFGGCLPLLLQMPIFIALFRVLGTGGLFVTYLKQLPPVIAELQKQFWILIPDLTMKPMEAYAAGAKAAGFLSGVVAALPYLILVILFGLSVWLPQFMMTKDKQQRNMGTYMAAFMLYIGWISPAGVLLYWVTSSAWQVAQQTITLRRLTPEEGA